VVALDIDERQQPPGQADGNRGGASCWAVTGAAAWQICRAALPRPDSGACRGTPGHATDPPCKQVVEVRDDHRK